MRSRPTVRLEPCVAQFRKFWDPYNFWKNQTIRFKFGTQIEDGACQRREHSVTTKWAWPASRDPISKFRDPL